MKEQKPEIKPVQNKEIVDETDSDENEKHEDLSESLKRKKLEEEASLFDGIECENSLWLLNQNTATRRFLLKLSQNHLFENFILFNIVLSSLKLAFDTYLADEDTTDPTDLEIIRISNIIDIVFNCIFATESLIKALALGLAIDKGSYLREPWNVMDFFIVCSSLLDMSLENVNLPIIKVN